MRMCFLNKLRLTEVQRHDHELIWALDVVANVAIKTASTREFEDEVSIESLSN